MLALKKFSMKISIFLINNYLIKLYNCFIDNALSSYIALNNLKLKKIIYE